MKASSVKSVRCAIYTRVSTEHGLDQEFNSLDAQYEAASAYIKSQAHAGWTLIRSRYDDGARKRPAPASSRPVPAAGPNTKHARIIAMLRTPAGATIASLVTATEWQQHSVRGFLAGVVRKETRSQPCFRAN